jgi:hypothetical protein
MSAPNLRLKSGGLRTCNQTVMSGRIKVRFVGFVAFSSEVGAFVAI